jgi:hypothetical protein
MELEIIMLSNMSQIQTNIHVFSHMWNLDKYKPYTQKDMIVKGEMSES